MKYSMKTLLCAAALGSGFIPLYAQQTDDEEEFDLEEVIVTGTRVRQGGAQDIRHFRSIADGPGIPRPESLTVEGLMGEHDLYFEPKEKCEQLFCIATDTMRANIPSRSSDLLFVGLGFGSNLDAAKWRREPVNLVAVVDKSGSMSGEPLALVRQSLEQIVGQLHPDDQISIVLYGDQSHVYLEPTSIKGNRDSIVKAIREIQSSGSTYMEAGLKVAYQTAYTTAPLFEGNTRLMLFTDERPNVGRTDANSFTAMAQEASKQGIGLTTIGVGVQFDASLATKISSTRGGNLFFLANSNDVETVFKEQLDTMVSELAHDLELKLSPAKGYKVSGVFGIPGDMMSEAKDGAITIRVPSVFLSKNGGGLFVTLGKASERDQLPAAPLREDKPLMEVSLSYASASSGQTETDQLAVAVPAENPSQALRLAHTLVDEYLSLKEAMTAFHIKNDPKSAYHLLTGLASRMDSTDSSAIADEQKLVDTLIAKTGFYAGYGSELSKKDRHVAIYGQWEVVGLRGIADLHVGDRLSFTEDRELQVLHPDEEDLDEEYEDFDVNERQIYLHDSDLVFDFQADGEKMKLTYRDGLRSLGKLRQPTIRLKRISFDAEE